jgi:hypothetical protein
MKTLLDHNQQIDIGYRTRSERILEIPTDCDPGIWKEKEKELPEETMQPNSKDSCARMRKIKLLFFLPQGF